MAQLNNVLGIEVKKRLDDISDIKQESGEAVKRSVEAKQNADEAKHRADITKKQLDAAMRDGNSIEEVLALAVDPLTGEVFDNASDRFEANQRDVITRLAQTAINPEQFEGTDREKVQQAFIQAAAENRAIRLHRLYVLTGEDPILLDKVGDTQRTAVYFIGEGGGFEKKDSGYMFSASNNNVGDFIFDNVRFQSTSGSGTIVFDTNRLIRITLKNPTFRYVDKIAKTKRFMQSFFVNGGSLVGGEGWAIEAPAVFDLQIGGGFFAEHRESFFLQTDDGETNFDRLCGARFRDCMVEGLTGTAFYFRDVESLVIDGVYFEANKGGHIIFDENARIDGTNISNNRVSEVDGSGIPAFVQWGGNIINAESSNNNVKRLPVHSTEYVKSGRIDSNKDRGFNPLSSGDIEINDVDPGNRIANITKSLNSINSNLTRIDDRVYDVQIQLQSKIDRYFLETRLQQIGSMTPRGAYSTLQALRNAYPNGTTGIFIVTSNGHWYYWSNSAWTDGGLYQASPWDDFTTEENEVWG